MSIVKVYEQPGTIASLGTDRQVVIAGDGLAICRTCSARETTPHMFFLHGQPFEPTFNGCTPALDGTLTCVLHLMGTDHEGTAWDVLVDMNSDYRDRSWVSRGARCVRLSHELTVALFKGRPFADIIAQFLEAKANERLAALEAELVLLREEAQFATRARSALAQILETTEAAGRGSRVAVRNLIIALMPELVSTLTK